MIKNYFLTAARILLRQKGYAAINVFGLALGIASCLLILMYITDELKYDRFHADIEQMHRIGFTGKLQDNELETAQTGMPVAQAMVSEIPEVSAAVRITKWATYPVRYEDKSFTENNFLVVDSNFFQFFDFHLVAGNPEDVLRGPNKIVITESAAKKYFDYTGTGDNSPLGKIILGGTQGERTLQVSGIAADPPQQSHIQFDFLLSMESWQYASSVSWVNTGTITYFKIHPDANISAVHKKLDFFIEKYLAADIQEYLGVSMKKFREEGNRVGFFTHPVKDIHLHSNVRDELSVNSNITYVYIFAFVAALIILLACINFMNLTTARSANRAKEVGIRKTIGALRFRLIGQFLLESHLYVILAVVVALAIVSLALNPFNILTGKQLDAAQILSPSFVAGLFLFTILIGLLSGSYPAFYLTNFRPVEVLKGKIRAGMKSSGIRNALVVFQFCISIGLIISTLVIYQQLKHLQKINLGFNKANVINLLHTWNLGPQSESFRNELLQHHLIENASFANRLPPNLDLTTVFRPEGGSQDHLFFMYFADHDHLETMGYAMVKGRFFSRDVKTDTAAVVLNESAARALGWYDDFDNKRLLTFWNDRQGKPLHVIGIIKDFNFETLKTAIKPLAIQLGSSPNTEMAVRLSGDDVIAAVSVVEKIWKKYSPQAPFEYSFIDQNFEAQFRTETRMGTVLLIFTFLAILIACLGLFGLATFTAEQRSKEISIRKVMGASVPQVMILLSKEFARLVVIAFIIAVPITWYGMNQWLIEFPYRIPFSATAVILAGVLSITVAVFTISFQSLKAALSNPVKFLRNE
ncbi:MAG TPA: ABC transporter permease [Ohtaekwangia sp.]|nr:ABC transporter permease [Ohtaekwangia sp.]